MLSSTRRSTSRALMWVVGLLFSMLVAAPALAEKASGLLNISASAVGAVVIIDGQEVGKTPLVQMASEGTHTLRIVADNFDPYVRKIDVTPNLTTRVDAKLTPGKGTIEFFVKPAGAKVFIDDREVGPAPIRVRELSDGTHTYRLEGQGHETKTGSFEFTLGKNLLIDAELRSTAGLFHVESTPQGATVYLDGWEAGVTPLDLDKIPGAEHHVRISLAGHAEVFRMIDTSDGSMGDVRARLSESGTRLVVRTGRPDAHVFIAGNDVGTGRKVVLKSIETGSYPLSIEANGYQTAVKTVRVTKARTFRVKANLARADSSSRGRVVVQKPLLERWTFWAASSTVAVAGGAGGVGVYLLTRPEPPPEGDVAVSLP